MKLPSKWLEKVLNPVWCLLATGLLVNGCATSPEPAFTSEPAVPSAVPSEAVAQPVAVSGGGPASDVSGLTQKDQGVRFRVGDQLIITFSGTSDVIAPHEERIKEDGNITLPHIGAVKAVGKSDGELQAEIHARYVPKFYVRLTVTVKYAMDLTYSVLGEVRAPGPKTYSGQTTLTKAIGAAGGLNEFAKKTELVLTRANGTILKVNYKKAIKDPKFDPQVFPGDSINVVRTWY